MLTVPLATFQLVPVPSPGAINFSTSQLQGYPMAGVRVSSGPPTEEGLMSSANNALLPIGRKTAVARTLPDIMPVFTITNTLGGVPFSGIWKPLHYHVVALRKTSSPRRAMGASLHGAVPMELCCSGKCYVFLLPFVHACHLRYKSNGGLLCMQGAVPTELFYRPQGLLQ